MTVPQILSAVLVVVELAIVFLLIPRVLIQRRDSAATLAWVLFILLVPLAGALLFYLLGPRRLRRRRFRRARARALLEGSGATLRSMLAHFKIEGPVSRSDPQAQTARSFYVDPEKATVGNEVVVFHQGEQAFSALCAAVSAAERHVHLEYYIFQNDTTGQRLLALLEERARAGVEVRLLVDAVGSWRLRGPHVDALIEAGGRFAPFLPVNPLTRPVSVNLRNHRKIVVVDGQLAFVGGMNIGDEYRGRDPNIGPWRDTHVQVRGPAVLRIQEIFAEDWHFATGERCNDARYIVAPTMPGSVVIDVVESGPDRTAESIYHRLFVAITRAEQRVWLTTPYFIPDRAVLVALITAALRGVDVRLLLPGWSDHRFVLYAGRAHYAELLRAGVRIFEYQPGMLHAKTMVVDERWVTIGSANMDRRSFYLNWEANLVMLDRSIAIAMGERFERDLELAREITVPYRPALVDRVCEGACMLMAPLL